jgi:hypothetical protein
MLKLQYATHSMIYPCCWCSRPFCAAMSGMMPLLAVPFPPSPPHHFMTSSPGLLLLRQALQYRLEQAALLPPSKQLRLS